MLSQANIDLGRSRACRVGGSVKVYGHRGAGAVAPANTLEAIEIALGVCDGFECDVRLTGDGHLVLMHDDDVSETTNGSGLVSTLTQAELRGLDAGFRFSRDGVGFPFRGRGVRVPLLGEVLECAAGRGRAILELKGDPFDGGDLFGRTAVALAAALGDRDLSAIVVSSFHVAGLGMVRERVRGLSTALLTVTQFDVETNLALALAGGHEGCHLPDARIDAAAVARCHAERREVVAWTVDDPARLRELAALGVDGAIADDPAAARAALQ